MTSPRLRFSGEAGPVTLLEGLAAKDSERGWQPWNNGADAHSGA
jgi:hypothetical protein